MGATNVSSISLTFDNCALELTCNTGGGDDGGGDDGGGDDGGNGNNVPEPGVVGLLGFSLAALVLLRRL